jgi:hypothetical protein
MPDEPNESQEPKKGGATYRGSKEPSGLSSEEWTIGVTLKSATTSDVEAERDDVER